jgi:hypothetical protein
MTDVDRLAVIARWNEADELPRCQHCPNLADERSFMCEDCAGKADAEVDGLREQLRGAVSRDLVDRARLQIVNAIEARHGEAISEDEAWRVVTDALDRLGGQ